MSFFRSIETGFSKYLVFQGRARRSEYSYWVLFHLLVGLFARFLETGAGWDWEPFGPLSLCVVLLLFLPTLSVTARRLHDFDASAWWILFSFVPLVNFALLISLLFVPGTKGDNRFGSDPKEIVSDASKPTDLIQENAVAPSVKAKTIGGMIDQIEKLAKLRNEGAISEEEYIRLKSDIIRLKE
jgi:uncharacterized membrane protein YhaH (DUF805 family)